MMKIREYKRVSSLEEAYVLNQKRSNRIIGGMLWLKMGRGRIQTAIDLSGLGLDTIEETEDTFVIGCMTTLRQLETHEGLNLYTQGAVREATRHLVGVQFRNLATVGGSLFGRFGFSDILTLFMVMDCEVELYKGGRVTIEKFASGQFDHKDILVRVIVKKTPARFDYQSVRNTKTDFPVLTCAGASVMGKARLAVGARPERAIRFDDADHELTDWTKEAIEDYAQRASETIVTGSNLRGSAAYRSHLIRVLARRVLTAIGGNENAD